MRGRGALLPELLRGLVCHPVPEFAKHNTHQFLILKAVIESFETPNLLDDLRWNAWGCALGHDLHSLWKKAKQALLLETADELPHRFRVGSRVVSTLRDGLLGGGALLKQDQGTDQFVAPLELIYEAQLQLGKLAYRFHGGSFP